MKTLFDYLAQIPDFRRSQGQRISLAAFMEMVVLAGMSGHFGINSITRFFKNNEDFFVKRYNLNHGVPSQGTVFNNLKQLPFDDLNKSLHSWMKQYVKSEDELWISIDGKAINSTLIDKNGSRQNFKSMVSLFCEKLGVVLDAVSIEKKKENEGEAARQLINQFESKGMTFTLDALHCQKKLSKQSWSLEMII